MTQSFTNSLWSTNCRSLTPAFWSWFAKFESITVWIGPTWEVYLRGCCRFFRWKQNKMLVLIQFDHSVWHIIFFTLMEGNPLYPTGIWRLEVDSESTSYACLSGCLSIWMCSSSDRKVCGQTDLWVLEHATGRQTGRLKDGETSRRHYHPNHRRLHHNIKHSAVNSVSISLI